MLSMFKNPIIPIILIGMLIPGCAKTDRPTTPPVSIIPQPVQQDMKKGSFQLNGHTRIVVDTSDPEMHRLGRYLAGLLNTPAWYDLPVVAPEATLPDTNMIVLTLKPGNSDFKHREGYTLDVNPERITVSASAPAGIFYGIQSLRQLFPPEIEYTDPTLVSGDTEWIVPAVEITDFPRFEYRGMHLDVGRHMFPVDFIKKYIDLMAYHKMNRFHWHLTEDQGWRIEIKRYPKLTEIGAWRDSTLVGHYGSGTYDGQRYGGYYTQQEIREIVSYARDRYITVIPEIEMPGHSSAALAAYPELGCMEDKKYRVKTTWGVFEDIYCPKESTFTFLENVLTEVMDLFPGPYIHIGGDEAPKAQWEQSPVAQRIIERENLEDEHELQSYFIQRIERFLNERGRKIIGWDEILEGGLAPNATVMSWRGTAGGIEAAKQGHNVIMTPGTHCYLDHYQADPETEPLAIGGFTPLEKVYSFDPVPGELSGREAEFILGAQGNVWTEYMHTGRKVEYMAYPRAAALAEVVWSPQKRRNWTHFWRRLQVHFERLDIIGVNYADHYEGTIPVFE